ncbi:MAG: beta-lactamase family protein [Planctomycetes bacterium]|nr:beta-lactamase family protein [Planctomycetota bacterium]
MSIPSDALTTAWQLLQRDVDDDTFPAVSTAVGVGDAAPATFRAGRLAVAAQAPAAGARLDVEPIFIIASPTKPMTATALMMLVEAGEVTLADPVARFFPDFAAQHKEAITLAHCLTHTSGLPDMLPDNVELRRANAPLDEFARGTCAVVPKFPAGTAVQYQSMGTLMLGRVVEKVTGQSLPAFLAERVFKPLEMHDTSLGMIDAWEQPGPKGEPARVTRIAEVRAPGKTSIGFSSWSADPGFGWNSPYWRRLGAPWGGMLSTATDLARWCRHLLSIHRGEDGVISRATLAAMTSNQLVHFPDVPETDRRCKPWGLGWQLNWHNQTGGFGDLLSPSAYGHWGSTGTMVWVDPDRDCYAVLLTSEPLSGDRRQHVQFTNALCRVHG